MRILVKSDNNVDIRPHINEIKGKLKDKQAKKENKKANPEKKAQKKKSVKPKKFGPYQHLSGGHWITIKAEDSPLHGRHLYINSSGTILAGAVPKSMQGKTISELHKPHKSFSAVHNDLSEMNEKQLASVKDQASGLHQKLGKEHLIGHSAKILHEIADHYHQVKQAKAGVPHIQETADHKIFSSLTPNQLNQYITNSKNQKLAEGMLNAKEKKVFEAKKKKSEEIAEHYLKQKIMEDAPHKHQTWAHEDALVSTPEDLKSDIDLAIKELQDPDYDSTAKEFYKQNIDIANHYLKNLHGEKEYLGQAPHGDEAKYNAIAKLASIKSIQGLKNLQSELFTHYKNGTASEEHAKKANAVINHFLTVKGGLVEGLPEKSSISSDAPHQDMKASHEYASKVSANSLKESIKNNNEDIKSAEADGDYDEVSHYEKQNAIYKYYLKTNHGIEMGDPIAGNGVVAGSTKGGHGIDNGDGTIDFTFHGMHNGKPGEHTVTIKKEKFSPHAEVTQAMDAFHHGAVEVKEDHPYVGKKVQDYGINPDDQIPWNTPIDHSGMGLSGPQIKQSTEALSNLIEGPGVGSASSLKAKVEKNLGTALAKNEKFLHAATAVLGWGKYNPEKASTPEQKEALARKAVDHIIHQWAGTSADHNSLAIAMQLAAKEEFGAHGSKIWYSTSTINSAKSQYLDEHMDGLRSFLREQYNQTQAWFKENGITHVPIIRGMKFENAKDLDGHTWQQFEKTNVRLQPLSSFSSSIKTAKNFTGGMGTGSGDNKLLTAAMIPVERVIGCPQTGYGCQSEQEFVVIGPPAGQQDKFITYAWNSYQHTAPNMDSLFKQMSEHVNAGDKFKSPKTADAPKAPKKEKKATVTKKPTKEYHVAFANGGSKPAVNAKHVINEHGIDAFVHKYGNGYKVSEGSTGVGMTSTYKTQKKAIEVFHDVINKMGADKIKEIISSKPKLTSHLTKSVVVSDHIPTIDADKDPQNQDWTKQSWDLPPYGSEEFNQYLENHNMTLEHFKELPVYRFMIDKQNMKKSEDRGYYPSQRHAYKTNHKDPIYLPLNRIQTPYQTDKALDEDKIRENVQKIKNGQALAPVIIGYDYDLHDGHHRYESAKRVGHSHIPCVVGGRNERRKIAAEKRYRSIYKSIVKSGKLLVKKSDDDDEIDIIADHKWITIKGSRVLIHKESGKVVAGHPNLVGKTFVTKGKKEESVKKSMMKNFIDSMGRLIFKK